MQTSGDPLSPYHEFEWWLATFQVGLAFSGMAISPNCSMPSSYGNFLCVYLLVHSLGIHSFN